MKPINKTYENVFKNVKNYRYYFYAIDENTNKYLINGTIEILPELKLHPSTH